MRLDIYIHDGSHNEIADLLREIKAQGAEIMATLDELVAKVEEVSGNVESMRTFILGIEQQLKDLLSGTVVSPAVQAKIDKMFADASKQSKDIVEAIDNDPNTPPAL